MKAFIFAAGAAACFAMPAMAQTWAGTNLVTFPAEGAPGVNWDKSTGGTYYSRSQALALLCFSTTMPQYSTPPCPTGKPLVYTSVISDAGGSNAALPSTLINTLPTDLSDIGVPVSGYYRDPTAPSGYSFLQAYVPISAFSTAGGPSDTAAAKIDAFIDEQRAENGALREQMAVDKLRTARGIAMVSSLSISSPVAGATNRLALGFGGYRNQGAVSVNYSRRAGHYDVGVASSWSGKDSLAKAAIGVNW